MEVPTIYVWPIFQAYVSLNITTIHMANNMVLSYVLTYLHFRILEFPLIYHHLPVKGVNLKMSYIISINQPYISDVY